MSNSVLPGSSKAEELAVQDSIRRAGVGAQMKIIGKDPFDLDLVEADRVTRAQELCVSRESNDAELSAHLYYINEARSFLNHGFDNMREFVEAPAMQNGFAFSYEKARSMIAAWEHYRDLNLLPGLLGGDSAISWSKFRILAPAIKSGIITELNVDAWLPLLTEAGEDSLTGTALKKYVAQTVAETKAIGDDKDSTVKYSVVLPADKYNVAQTCESVIMNGLNIDETDTFARGQVVIAAMQNYAAVVAGQDAEAWRSMGLGSMKTIIEQIAPNLTCVFVGAEDDESLDPDSLGIIPVTAVYQGFVKEGRKKVPVFTLAASEEDALAALGVDEVQRFPLTLGSHEPKASEGLEIPVNNSEEPELEVAEVTKPTKPRKKRTPKLKLVIDDTPAQPRTEYARVPIKDRDSVMRQLAKPLSDKQLVNSAIFQEAREQIVAEIPDDSDDENFQVFKGVCEWLYDRLDEHSLTVTIPL
jgi:hypothetical protein